MHNSDYYSNWHRPGRGPDPVNDLKFDSDLNAQMVAKLEAWVKGSRACNELKENIKPLLGMIIPEGEISLLRAKTEMPEQYLESISWKESIANFFGASSQRQINILTAKSQAGVTLKEAETKNLEIKKEIDSKLACFYKDHFEESLGLSGYRDTLQHYIRKFDEIKLGKGLIRSPRQYLNGFSQFSYQPDISMPNMNTYEPSFSDADLINDHQINLKNSLIPLAESIYNFIKECQEDKRIYCHVKGEPIALYLPLPSQGIIATVECLRYNQINSPNSQNVMNSVWGFEMAARKELAICDIVYQTIEKFVNFERNNPVKI